MQHLFSFLRQLWIPTSHGSRLRPVVRTHLAVEALEPRLVLSASGVRVENPLWTSNGALTERKVLPGGTQGDGRCLERSGNHKGMDLLAAEGTPVHPAAAGVVVSIIRSRKENQGGKKAAGNLVILKHTRPGGGTFYTKYFHLRDVPRRLKEGQKVKKGQIIGHVGRTGNVVPGGDTHLHFEVRRGLGLKSGVICPDLGPGRLFLTQPSPDPTPLGPARTYHITGHCPDGTFGVLAAGIPEADLPAVLADFQGRGCVVRAIPDRLFL